MRAVDLALKLAANGRPVFPCKDDKRPATEHGHLDATCNLDEVRRMFRERPGPLVGVNTGAAGLVVLDIDVKNGVDGYETFAALCLDLGVDLSDTMLVDTPSGGQHVYFTAGDYRIGCDTLGKLIGPGIDVKAEGGYVIAPGSGNGHGDYLFVDGHGPERLRELPPALGERLAFACRPAGSRDQAATAAKAIPAGGRNATLASMAGKWRRDGMDPDELEAALLVANAKRCKPPLPDREVSRIAASIGRYAPDPRAVAVPAPTPPADAPTPARVPPYFPLTDTGNAERFAADHEGEVYHAGAWGYLAWDAPSGRFVRDPRAVSRRAKATMRGVYAEAAEAIESDLRTAVSKHARKSESAAARQAMLKLAECELQLQARVEDFDADPMLLNAVNGVVDLRTGELTPHDPKHRMTHVAGAAYDPEADCPLWTAHLERVFAGDETLVDFFQRLSGYALSGLVVEQCLAILHGTGANGKSVTVETLRSAAGDYAMTADFSAFSVRRGDGPRNDLARLAGARIVTAAETSAAQKLDEAVVKQATGGEPVAARFLYGESFEYQPQFTLFLSTNHKPDIAGTDHGIWRRVRLIPFDVVIPDAEQDHGLTGKLRGEIPGILAWMVEGCREWQQRGLEPPPRVREATDAYRLDMDSLGAFIDEHLVEDSNTAVAAGSVYKAFKVWAEQNHEKIISQRAFSARLAERGVKVSGREPGSGRYLYLGFRLQSFTDEGICEPFSEPSEAL